MDGSGLGTLMSLQSICQPGLQSPEDVTRSGEPAFRKAHSHGCGLEASVPYMWTSPQGCHCVLKNVTLCFLQSDEREWERGSHNVFYNLILEVTYHHLCHILLVYCGERLCKGVNARMWGSLKAILKARYHGRSYLSSSRMNVSPGGKLQLTWSLDTDLLAITAFGREVREMSSESQ